jgi:hypothetical protein
VQRSSTTLGPWNAQTAASLSKEALVRNAGSVSCTQSAVGLAQGCERLIYPRGAET